MTASWSTGSRPGPAGCPGSWSRATCTSRTWSSTARAGPHASPTSWRRPASSRRRSRGCRSTAPTPAASSPARRTTSTAAFVICGTSPPDSFRIGAVLPVEGERWMVTLAGVHGDVPGTAPDEVLSFARSLPTPAVGAARRAVGPAVIDHLVPVPVQPAAPLREGARATAGRFVDPRRRGVQLQPRLRAGDVVRGIAGPGPRRRRGGGGRAVRRAADAVPPRAPHGSSTPRGRSRWAPTSCTRGPSARSRRPPTSRTGTPSDSCGRPTRSLPLARTFNRVVNLVEPPLGAGAPLGGREGRGRLGHRAAGGAHRRSTRGWGRRHLNRTRASPVSPCVTAVEVRVSSQWLRLREPADAAARSTDLARMAVALLDGAAPTVVHDLGCGSGSMGRWLAPLLEGPQHWVLHDRDADLLERRRGRPAPGGCRWRRRHRRDPAGRPHPARARTTSRARRSSRPRPCSTC